MQTDLRPAPWPSLFEPQRVFAEIATGPIQRVLDKETRREIAAVKNLSVKVAGALEHPKPLDTARPVLNAVLAAQYFELLTALELPRRLRIYEPCVGASHPVLLAAEAHSQGAASYLTINLNRKLCAELRRKIAHLKMAIQIIEDNAQRALALIPAHGFDVACFHHAINDILQTAVSEPRGMDTTAIDWFPSERQMIEWLAEDSKSGRLEERGKPELLQIIGDAVRMVRPGGYLLFDHFNWHKFIGVDWFPWQLFYDFIPTTRRWIAESSLPVHELRFEGVDPQWWMVLQVE